ncbi:MULTISPECIES: hypothetical protein [Lactobacillus]|nr:hypothetical protein [Lactobacillus kullabergensis]
MVIPFHYFLMITEEAELKWLKKFMHHLCGNQRDSIGVIPTDT